MGLNSEKRGHALTTHVALGGGCGMALDHNPTRTGSHGGFPVVSHDHAGCSTKLASISRVMSGTTVGPTLWFPSHHFMNRGARRSGFRTK